jgi:membrane protein implicated in regulation of membrane protease activity
MTPKPNSSEAGGTGMLLVIAFATVFVVSVEGVLIAFASWWLLPVTLLAVIVMALVVIGAVLRTIDDGGLSGALPPREAEPETQPAASARTVAPRALRHA